MGIGKVQHKKFHITYKETKSERDHTTDHYEPCELALSPDGVVRKTLESTLHDMQRSGFNFHRFDIEQTRILLEDIKEYRFTEDDGSGDLLSQKALLMRYDDTQSLFKNYGSGLTQAQHLLFKRYFGGFEHVVSDCLNRSLDFREICPTVDAVADLFTLNEFAFASDTDLDAVIDILRDPRLNIAPSELSQLKERLQIRSRLARSFVEHHTTVRGPEAAYYYDVAAYFKGANLKPTDVSISDSAESVPMTFFVEGNRTEGMKAYLQAFHDIAELLGADAAEMKYLLKDTPVVIVSSQQDDTCGVHDPHKQMITIFSDMRDQGRMRDVLVHEWMHVIDKRFELYKDPRIREVFGKGYLATEYVATYGKDIIESTEGFSIDGQEMERELFYLQSNEGLNTGEIDQLIKEDIADLFSQCFPRRGLSIEDTELLEQDFERWNPKLKDKALMLAKVLKEKLWELEV